jgi:hypothetical protein
MRNPRQTETDISSHGPTNAFVEPPTLRLDIFTTKTEISQHKSMPQFYFQLMYQEILPTLGSEHRRTVELPYVDALQFPLIVMRSGSTTTRIELYFSPIQTRQR